MWGNFQKLLDTVKISLRLRAEKHQLISSNIANIDTPGYRRKDLPFEKVMQSYLKQERLLKTSSPRHIPLKDRKIDDLVKRFQPDTLGTPNNVNLEEEMTALTENQLLYESTLQALAKELERLREIITEGGK